MMLLVFGDSITYGLNDDKGGWVGRLRKELEKEYLANAGHVENTVYNCGIRGDTTEQMLKRFDIELSSRADRQDDPVILFAIGTNDSCTSSSGSNTVPAANYRENLGKLLEKAQTVTDKVILSGPIPHGRDQDRAGGLELQRILHQQEPGGVQCSDKRVLQGEGPGICRYLQAILQQGLPRASERRPSSKPEGPPEDIQTGRQGTREEGVSPNI